MKKIATLALVAGLMAPSLALAKGGNHPMSGCGLGYVLFGNTDNSKVMQVFAGTTNTIFGNQTFGITSGTSGCTADGAVKFAKEAEVFAEVNLDSLKREMAVGQGDYVTAFAHLLGATDAQTPSMLKLFQTNYAMLFPTATTASGDMMASLSGILNS
jgi:hypothetical protein